MADGPGSLDAMRQTGSTSFLLFPGWRYEFPLPKTY